MPMSGHLKKHPLMHISDLMQTFIVRVCVILGQVNPSLARSCLRERVAGISFVVVVSGRLWIRGQSFKLTGYTWR
jgi:hypothetical protein